MFCCNSDFFLPSCIPRNFSLPREKQLLRQAKKSCGKKLIKKNDLSLHQKKNILGIRNLF